MPCCWCEPTSVRDLAVLEMGLAARTLEGHAGICTRRQRNINPGDSQSISPSFISAHSFTKGYFLQVLVGTELPLVTNPVLPPTDCSFCTFALIHSGADADVGAGWKMKERFTTFWPRKSVLESDGAAFTRDTLVAASPTLLSMD